MYILNMPPPPQNVSSVALAGLGKMMPRPNQSVQRATYYFPTHTTTRQLQGLGQSTISTPLLIGGAAVLGLAAWMLLGKKKSSSKRIARLASQRALAAAQLKAMGA